MSFGYHFWNLTFKQQSLVSIHPPPPLLPSGLEQALGFLVERLLLHLHASNHCHAPTCYQGLHPPKSPYLAPMVLGHNYSPGQSCWNKFLQVRKLGLVIGFSRRREPKWRTGIFTCTVSTFGIHLSHATPSERPSLVTLSGGSSPVKVHPLHSKLTVAKSSSALFARSIQDLIVELEF